MRRREFLSTAAAAPLLTARRSAERRCILLMLVGGPSQIDTFDPKPGAPREVRGPFRAIRTSVAGIRISEIFPRTARHADKYSLVRSVHHDAAPVHDFGHQLAQTGRVFRRGDADRHVGCRIAETLGGRHVLLPGPIGPTGGGVSHGQDAVPVAPLRCRDAGRYGGSRFGRSCLEAFHLVEAGTRFVTVNMFGTVFDQPTWDAHGYAPFCSLDCYHDVVGPTFDRAFAALLEDLAATGLLDETMVVAMGEFGRSPRLNHAGGRDHWTRCYTVLMGGGPLKGGEVIGASDAIGAEPRDRPVTPQEILATLYAGFGLPSGVVAAPIHELLA